MQYETFFFCMNLLISIKRRVRPQAIKKQHINIRIVFKLGGPPFRHLVLTSRDVRTSTADEIC